MIRPLRRLHLAAFAVLAAVLPSALALTLAARRAIPTVPVLPPGLEREPPVPIAGIWRSETSIRDRTVKLRAWRGPRAPWLEVDLAEDLELPDALVYWAPKADDGAGVPADATLVGSLGGDGRRGFELPLAATDGGSLIFYSLGHRERVGTTALPAF